MYSSRREWATAKKYSPETRRAHAMAREIRENLTDAKTGQLKLSRQHKPDRVLFVLSFSLSLIGLVVLASMASAATGGEGVGSFILKQIIFLCFGVAAFFIASKIPLDFWRKHGGQIFLLALFLCFLLPILGVLHIPLANCTNGACRWYNFGFASFQPAEFLKFGILLFSSGYLAAKMAQNKLNNLLSLAAFALPIIVALIVIAIFQKDLGTAVALAAIVLAQLFVAGLSARKFAILLAVFAIGGVLLIAMAPHRLQRVATFFGSGNDTIDYQIEQALIALGSGGFLGKGLGQSVQAFGWLPEAKNDSIFPIFGEMFGFVGAILLLGAFIFLLKRIIDKVDFTENAFLRLILAGVFGWLATHVILNIGSMIHALPLTGITLPLVSQGGTSVVFVMAALGLVYAISRYTLHRKIDIQKGGDNDANSLSRRRQRRPHYANRGSF